MTATKSVTIWCDGSNCLRWTYGAGEHRTVGAARRGAHSTGWTYRDGKDLCPLCKTKERP